jgi:hypothetical protein
MDGVDAKDVHPASRAYADVPSRGLKPARIIKQSNGKTWLPKSVFSDKCPGPILRHSVHDYNFQRSVVLLADGVENSHDILEAISHHDQHAHERTLIHIFSLFSCRINRRTACL